MIRREAIKRLRAALEEGNMMGPALKKAGIRNNNFIGYHNKGMYQDRLKLFFEACRARGQQRRDDIVEDAQFKRLAEGKASGSEYEFYLTNRRTDRWKKLNEFGSTQGAPVLLKPPIINYISVSVTNGKSEVVQDNGNGNGRHLDHV